MSTDVIKKDDIQALDKVAQNAALMIRGEASFEAAFAVADAINSLKEAITPPMMQRFMSLQNSALGFKTDRNPAVKGRNGEYPEPYPEPVVKLCVIEAVLRGLRVVGNQMNIISGGMYITREGYQYLIKKIPGLTDFSPSIGVFRYNADKTGAIVPCEATWKIGNTPGSIKCEIPLAVINTPNYQDKPDTILGKAQRKFLKRVYDQITGSETPGGEVDDGPDTLPPQEVAKALPEVKPEPPTELLEKKPEKVYDLNKGQLLDAKTGEKASRLNAPVANPVSDEKANEPITQPSNPPVENDDLEEVSEAVKLTVDLAKLAVKDAITEEEICTYAAVRRQKVTKGFKAESVEQLASKFPEEVKAYIGKWDIVKKTIIDVIRKK